MPGIHIQFSPCTSGAEPKYYDSSVNDPIIVIENVNCYLDELRLRDCLYSNYTISYSCQNHGRIAGVGCKVISNIEFAMVNNSVLVTWEYSNKTSQRPSSFDVGCNGQQHYNNTIISVSNGISRVSVGDFHPNSSYGCCVSAKYKRSGGSITTTEIRCASIRSEDLLPPTTISDSNMMATVTVVGAVLGCIIVILLVLLVVCGGALFHLLRSRASSKASKR